MVVVVVVVSSDAAPADCLPVVTCLLLKVENKGWADCVWWRSGEELRNDAPLWGEREATGTVNECTARRRVRRRRVRGNTIMVGREVKLFVEMQQARLEEEVGEALRGYKKRYRDYGGGAGGEMG